METGNHIGIIYNLSQLNIFSYLIFNAMCFGPYGHQQVLQDKKRYAQFQVTQNIEF
jgi:hypothetical protein